MSDEVMADQEETDSRAEIKIRQGKTYEYQATNQLDEDRR